ncbi:MAG TPA: hypothetical protein DCF63_12215 [Planctomycetaceae bacterium]|nr:hypothetical protein [Planctomycetaceae bacterium]
MAANEPTTIAPQNVRLFSSFLNKFLLVKPSIILLDALNHHAMYWATVTQAQGIRNPRQTIG